MSKLLILLVIVLGVVAIAFLMRTYELGRKLSNRKEEEISDKDNDFTSKMFIVFMVFYLASVIYLSYKYGNILNVAASEHGKTVDWIMDFNWVIILATFFITSILLFVFTYKYRRKKGVSAYYYPHNSKLELLWTAVPSAVLTVVVIFGIVAWRDITKASPKDAINVEVFSEQFKWTVRYAGQDNVLGDFDYKLTTDKNLLGLVTTASLDSAIQLMEFGAADGTVLGIKQMEEKLNDKSVIIVPEVREQMVKDLDRKTRLLRHLYQMRGRHDAGRDKNAFDDVIENDTLHLILDKNYEMTFRAKDVIHSALLSHFRVQMNTVPGMVTRFKFKPTITTKEMREKMNDPNFDYALLCNKICGSAHYKMKMIVVVETQEEFDAWMKKKQTFKSTFLAENETTTANENVSLATK
ncbi:MAG TPA: cytochrome c oxidase subunit II [Crocinitomicaceae bacterium]|nr:cytochrome c oxidase subunit II [Crocinitomicaceae bacterium]